MNDTLTPTDLGAFTIAYLECALWAETDNADESGGVPLDSNYGLDDFTPEAIKRAITDCRKFQAENAALLQKAHYNNDEFSDDEMAGHDFWLTRHSHGAGFWDRELGEVGDKLTEACKAFGECWVVVGDDGRLHIG